MQKEEKCRTFLFCLFHVFFGYLVIHISTDYRNEIASVPCCILGTTKTRFYCYKIGNANNTKIVYVKCDKISAAHKEKV